MDIDRKQKWSFARKVLQGKASWPFSQCLTDSPSEQYHGDMYPCNLIDLGKTDYEATWDFQKILVQARLDKAIPETLILTEHNPVITFGRRAQDTDVLASEDDLDRAGMHIYKIERGGLVTYHGPGQLVAYPIFRLRHLKLGVVEFVAHIEDVILAVLSDFGISGVKRKGHPGVWASKGKIASIGLAVRRGITFHGLALNYHPDLTHFQMINPCGLTDEGMTSMALETGGLIDQALLKQSMAEHFQRIFHLDLNSWPADQASQLAPVPEDISQ